MTRLELSALLIAAATALGLAQGTVDLQLDEQLRQLFPAALSFSGRMGTPPHFEAYSAATPSPDALIGIAIWTTDLDPLERGYDGPIKILVGLDRSASITGIVVADHHEPYGYFSVDRPEFARQFRGKSLLEPFKVGGDVDAVSRATLTVSSATRAIRNSARRAVRALPRPSR